MVPHVCRAFHLQAATLFKDAAEVDSWLRSIQAPVLVAAGDKDFLTPLVRLCGFFLGCTASSTCCSAFEQLIYSGKFQFDKGSELI